MLYIIIMLHLFWRWFSDFEPTRMAVDSVYSKDEDSLVLGGNQQTAGMGLSLGVKWVGSWSPGDMRRRLEESRPQVVGFLYDETCLYKLSGFVFLGVFGVGETVKHERPKYGMLSTGGFFVHLSTKMSLPRQTMPRQVGADTWGPFWMAQPPLLGPVEYSV